MPNPVLVAFASLVIQSAPVAQNCKPVEGTFIATVVTDNCHARLCTAGTLTGGLEGTYAFHETKQTKAGKRAPSIAFFLGESTVTLKDGRSLTGVDAGTLDTAPDRGGFASLISWSNGGQIRLRGVMEAPNPKTLETKGDYRGTVCDSPKK